MVDSNQKEDEVKKELEEKDKKRKAELNPASSTDGENKKVRKSEKEEKAEEEPARSEGGKE